MTFIVVQANKHALRDRDAVMVMADRRISVVVAEDSLLVRDSVCRALSTDPDVEVVGEGVDYDSTVELLDRHNPTLLVTDVRMPPTSTDEGIRLAHWLRTAHPDTGVIVLSQYAQPEYAAGCWTGALPHADTY
jgi:DNA-binding NarL/FixJ family response regulator